MPNLFLAPVHNHGIDNFPSTRRNRDRLEHHIQRVIFPAAAFEFGKEMLMNSVIVQKSLQQIIHRIMPHEIRGKRATDSINTRHILVFHHGAVRRHR